MLLQVTQLLEGPLAVGAGVLADVGVHQGMLGQLLLAAEPFQAGGAQVGTLRGGGDVHAHFGGVDSLRVQLQGGGGGGRGHGLGGQGVLVVQVQVQAVLGLDGLVLQLL